jgi:hypothetical protein
MGSCEHSSVPSGSIIFLTRRATVSFSEALFLGIGWFVRQLILLNDLQTIESVKAWDVKFKRVMVKASSMK